MTRESGAFDVLRHVPFVRNIQYLAADRDKSHGGELELQTPVGRSRFLVETKRSFLTRSELNQFLAWVRQLDPGQARHVMLLARHIPRPVAERLIEAQVNFADDAGNIHLVLGDRYGWTDIGRPAPNPVSDRRPISASQLQLLFQFSTYPDSVNWPVRRLEKAAGISKSKAAQGRKQLVAEGLLTRMGEEYQLGPRDSLAERLSSGYAQILRPKLLAGRFCFPEKTAERFLHRLRNGTPSGVRYALSGGPAAELMQRFYRGPEIPLFLEPSSSLAIQELRLLPDKEGPVIVLRAFGELVFWEEHRGHTVAPPWLIYAELLNTDDPRAHEAALEFRRQFLA